MDPIHPTDLHHGLSMVPNFPHSFEGRRIWLAILCQLAICIVSSIVACYWFLKKFYSGREKTWKRTVDVIDPIRKRFQNLEKEKMVWNSYVEWIEDYCSVYYGLLSYLNASVFDLDKLYREHETFVKNLSESSLEMGQSERDSTREGLSACEGGFGSDSSWDGFPSDEETVAMVKSHLQEIFVNAKRPCKYGSGDLKGENRSTTASEGSEEFFKGDIELLNTFNDDSKFVEYMEAIFLGKRHLCTEFQALYPLWQGSVTAGEMERSGALEISLVQQTE